MEESQTEKLARWWNTLNGWEWPEDLGGKPDGFDVMADIIRNGEDFQPNKYDWTGSIMRKIEIIIGHKETLRWHWIHNLEKTNEEFELWYKFNGE